MYEVKIVTLRADAIAPPVFLSRRVPFCLPLGWHPALHSALQRLPSRLRLHRLQLPLPRRHYPDCRPQQGAQTQHLPRHRHVLLGLRDGLKEQPGLGAVWPARPATANTLWRPIDFPARGDRVRTALPHMLRGQDVHSSA